MVPSYKVPAAATERTPTASAEQSDNTSPILYSLGEFTCVDVIAQHAYLTVDVELSPERPCATVAIGDDVGRRDDDIAFGLVVAPEHHAIGPAYQQMIVVGHVTAPKLGLADTRADRLGPSAPDLTAPPRQRQRHRCWS